ncbi:MAG: hypothetical protein JO300_01310 [Silvibacterium sp.]|nr:hypothetical protein [Silvibacterium sp.]MBV8436814.1 hypothetical protein [Silvibacterium sp.]
MRSMIRSLVLTSAALFATAAFAADKAVVNVPFNFESHGQAYPAGQYQVSLDPSANVITLSNMANTAQSVRWTAGPADYDAGTPILRMKFDADGYNYELRSVQIARRITSVLDAPAKYHLAGSYVATVSGQ